MEESRFRDLITRAGSGDTWAADCLFVASHEPLRAVVAGLMDPVMVRARLEPEDVLQEAFAAAWPKIESAEFRDFAAFVAWLKTIARNKLIDLRRGLLADKNNVLRQVDAPPPANASYLNLLDCVCARDPTPSRGAARNEAMAIMNVQIARLPKDYRQVIRWRFIQGLPVAEVARRLQRSESAVHMLCHRALKKLQSLMGSSSKYLSAG